MEVDVYRSGSLVGARLWSLLVVGLLIGGFGCGDAASTDEEDRNSHRSAESLIKNGTVDSSNTAAVGMVVDRGRGFGVCSGTLIAPNLVLTARHCVSETSGGRGVQCGESSFGSTLQPSDINVTTATRIRNARNYYAVEKLIVGDSDNFCGDDIALMRLQSNVPDSEADPREPQLGETINQGDSYTAIGYGTTGQDESGGSGVRRKLEGQSVRCVGGQCFRIVDGEWQGSGGVCQGDSGGGAYANDGKVFGIASRGGGDCDYVAYTSVPPNAQLIRKAAQKAAADGNYQPPSWSSTGHDDDGDSVGSNYDNCPNTANPEQNDTDGDGKGDVCDPDIDGDGVPNEDDNCAKTKNPRQGNLDRDDEGNACDDDLDGDRIPNKSDVCPTLNNPSQESSGDDGSCKDADGDGVADVDDNCPNTSNWEQSDPDGDGTGAACDSDESKPEPDTGMGGPDAGSGGDAGSDVSIQPVPQPVEEGEDGCAMVSSQPAGVAGWLLLTVGFLLVRRRRE